MASPILPPINLHKWIEENKEFLRPPVSNKLIYNGPEFMVQVVGGPNARTDFHVEAGPEWFYQITGDMVVRIMDPSDHQIKDISIREGEMFMLPPLVPHSPQRKADTVGLVIERQRRREEPEDILRWYCEKCQQIVYEESFFCTNLGTQLKPVIEAYFADPVKRTCKACNHLNPAK